MPSLRIRPLHTHDPDEVAAVAALAGAENWPTFADPALLRRLAAAPGTLTLVAIDERSSPPAVIAFAHALTNGHHAYLSVLAVDGSVRRQGVGRQLVSAVFETCGVERMDLLSGTDSEGFYERLPHRKLAGFRLFPGDAGSG